MCALTADPRAKRLRERGQTQRWRAALRPLGAAGGVARRVLWDFDDPSDGGRVIPGILNPLALAVAPFPRFARLAADEQACALLPGDEVRCWSGDVPDGGSRRVTIP